MTNTGSHRQGVHGCAGNDSIMPCVRKLAGFWRTGTTSWFWLSSWRLCLCWASCLAGCGKFGSKFYEPISWVIDSDGLMVRCSATASDQRLSPCQCLPETRAVGGKLIPGRLSAANRIFLLGMHDPPNSRGHRLATSGREARNRFAAIHGPTLFQAFWDTFCAVPSSASIANGPGTACPEQAMLERSHAQQPWMGDRALPPPLKGCMREFEAYASTQSLSPPKATVCCIAAK